MNMRFLLKNRRFEKIVFGPAAKTQDLVID